MTGKEMHKNIVVLGYLVENQGSEESFKEFIGRMRIKYLDKNNFKNITILVLPDSIGNIPDEEEK